MTKEGWQQLNTEIGNNLEANKLYQDQSTNEGTTERLHRMNSCINSAVEKCVSNKKRLSDIKRGTSDETRRLYYEVRARKFGNIEAAGGKVSRQLRKRWHRKIRDANLKDYNIWLDKIATEMEIADSKRATQSLYSEFSRL